MITLADILQHITQELGCAACANTASGHEAKNAEETFQLRVSITTDVEDAELSHLSRHGSGSTLYFRIRNYEQGKKLAEGLFELMPNVLVEDNVYTGTDGTAQLYLFIHIRRALPRAEETHSLHSSQRASPLFCGGAGTQAPFFYRLSV